MTKSRKIKTSFLFGFVAVLALMLSVTFASMPKAKQAKAAVATEYTVVETPMFGGIKDIYAAGGNVQLHITIPALDNGDVTGDDIAFDGVDLPTVFNSFGFFDNVMISGKTLRELGCTTFWNHNLGYNVAEPNPSVYIHLHFEPDKLAAAMADGTVKLGHMEMSPVSFKEGTVIPGYRYLAGLDNAILFKAGCEYETSVSNMAYERVAVGKTEVNSLKYVQDNRDGTGYFGVSLFGDDFAGVGNTEDCVGNNLSDKVTGWYH